MYIELKMSALGQGEICDMCEKKFARGENMNAVRYDDNEVAGWWCDGCISDSMADVAKEG